MVPLTIFRLLDAWQRSTSGSSLDSARSDALADSPSSQVDVAPEGWDDLEAICPLGRMLTPPRATSRDTLAYLARAATERRLPRKIQAWEDHGAPNEVAAAVYSDTFAFFRKHGFDELNSHWAGAWRSSGRALTMAAIRHGSDPAQWGVTVGRADDLERLQAALAAATV